MSIPSICCQVCSDRNVGCTPFLARVLLNATGSQGKCVSFVHLQNCAGCSASFAFLFKLQNQFVHIHKIARRHFECCMIYRSSWENGHHNNMSLPIYKYIIGLHFLSFPSIRILQIYTYNHRLCTYLLKLYLKISFFLGINEMVWWISFQISIFHFQYIRKQLTFLQRPFYPANLLSLLSSFKMLFADSMEFCRQLYYL